MQNIENKLHKISEIIFKIITPSGSGSGFYMKNYDIIVTNCHVVSGFHDLSIEDFEKNRYLWKVIFMDRENDIAFIRCQFDIPPTLELEISDDTLLKSRDEVFVLWYPFWFPYTITKWIISSTKQLIDGKNLIQTDAAVNPGNSWGAMVDNNGKLIAITVSKIASYNADNMGFGIPVNHLKENIEILLNKKSDDFCIKCSACHNLVYEKSSFCKSCGSPIEKELFDQRNITKLSEKIEEIIQKNGINPILARTSEEYWTFYYHSKYVKILIDNDWDISLSSPLFTVPKNVSSDFYEFLLGDKVSVYKIGFFDEEIQLLYRIHISDILWKNEQEYKENLEKYFTTLDFICEYSKTHFGTEKSKYDKM